MTDVYQRIGRSNFFSATTINRPGVVAIVDADDGSTTVTNDAENVVQYLYATNRLKPGEHLIYRDTMGRWDEIVHFDGKFVGFHMLGERHPEAAIDAALTRGFQYG